MITFFLLILKLETYDSLMITLYHYVHCPFCVRVRIGFGLLGVNFQSKVLRYDDEETPLKLTTKKMLPIVQWDDGSTQNESLDILRRVDIKNQLNWNLLDSRKDEINNLLDQIAQPVHSLCMPYWVWTPEFDEASRKYFQSKKELKRGPFKNLIQNKNKYIEELDEIIASQIVTHLQPFFHSQELTILDILMASHLWGMYIFPEYQFSPQIHSYLQAIKHKTGFEYHQDFWS